MLILAIDTALDACAAGVLDTGAGKLIAQESLPMKRGHAEALMPLIARVIEEALGASRFGAPYLVGNAADILADRWPAHALPPFKVDAQGAPDIAWVAWLGAAVSPNTAPARPFYLRAPDAKLPKDPLQKASQPSAS